MFDWGLCVFLTKDIGLFELTRTSVSEYHGRTVVGLDVGTTTAGSFDEI
jgi:hypothetical protein